MKQIDFPYHLGENGDTASSTPDDHIRDLIEQVLFTAPGERVNRPTFGSGLMQLVFAPKGDVLAAATQATLQGALQQWLGELIQVKHVEVSGEDSMVRVKVQYIVRRSGQPQSANFEREA